MQVLGEITPPQVGFLKAVIKDTHALRIETPCHALNVVPILAGK